MAVKRVFRGLGAAQLAGAWGSPLERAKRGQGHAKRMFTNRNTYVILFVIHIFGRRKA